MNKYKGMSIAEALLSQPTLKTSDLEQIFNRSSRSFNRWQQEGNYHNPMPKPIMHGTQYQNVYCAYQLHAWSLTLPLKPKVKK
jgi:hypothetical protein